MGGSALRAVLRKNVTDGFECVAVPVITLEVPGELYERMRKFDVEWNWVVRRAIESYIENLEGGGVAVPAEELLKEQNRLGVQPQDLEPLSPEVEDKMYGEMRERRALDG
jgi:predicted DNA-binding protein